MIGTSGKNYSVTKPETVVKLIDELTVNEPYNTPNLFQDIAQNVAGVPCLSWEKLLKHSYTPTYIKTNFSSFICAVKAILDHTSDKKTIKETIMYTYNRILYDKNKKRVFITVVENLLPNLLDNYTLPEVKKLLDDIILNRDSIALLEANLLANMPNYTNTLLAVLSKLSVEHCSQLFEILCTKTKSKNGNKLLLKTYLEVNNNKVECNVALLDLITKYRLYQVKGDQEQGDRLTNHFSQLLSHLEEDDYCRVAVKVLPLNFSVVSVARSCSYCNDSLLAQLVETYHKVGKLLQLFEMIIKCFNPGICIGVESHSRLIGISSRLTEHQTRGIVQLFCGTLEEHSGFSPDSPVTKKKKLYRWEEEHVKLDGFIAKCCSIVLLHNNHNLTKDSPDLFNRLFHVANKLPQRAGDILKLFFSDAVSARLLPQNLLPQITEPCVESSEHVELLINNLQYSETTLQDTDTILSYLDTYPTVILNNISVLYSFLHTSHMFSLARYLLATQNFSFLSHETSTRLAYLHSVIVVCILNSLHCGDETYTAEPLHDITMSKAREIIKLELSRKVPNERPQNIDYTIKIVSQLSLNSCYLRLLVTSWILARRYQYYNILTRFCRPPTPHPPIPVVHGKYAGHTLTEILPYCTDTKTLDFVRLYLRSGVPVNSVDITELLRSLSDKPLEYSAVVDVLVSVLVGMSNAMLYHDELQALNTSITKSLEVCRDGNYTCLPITTYTRVTMATTRVSRCELVGALYSLAGLLSIPVLQYDTAVSTLSLPGLDMRKKLELAQTVLEYTEDEQKIVEITNTLLKLDLESASHITFKSENKIFINTLITNLPNKAAEILLNQCVFRGDMIGSINTIVPLALLPKLISKMSKKQVMESMHQGAKDAKLLSKCLLCLVQNGYPIHLLNSVFNLIFTSMTTERCLADPDTISNIVRSCELIGKQREVARHHAPYILITILEYISQSNTVIVRAVTPAVYPLLEVCVVQGLQFLQTRLSQGAKQLFVQMQDHHRQNIKYQGKT